MEGLDGVQGDMIYATAGKGWLRVENRNQESWEDQGDMCNGGGPRPWHHMEEMHEFNPGSWAIDLFRALVSGSIPIVISWSREVETVASFRITLWKATRQKVGALTIIDATQGGHGHTASAGSLFAVEVAPSESKSKAKMKWRGSRRSRFETAKSGRRDSSH